MSKHRAATLPEPAEAQLGLERIVFFSDAVMAIAITLLAVDIRLPEVDAASGTAALLAELSRLTPQIISLVISFCVIGIYWISHHRYFGYIQRYNGRLILLNMVFLFFIVCMPFISSMLGSYGFQPLPVMLYSLAVAALGLSLGFTWIYAAGEHRLVDPNLSRQTIRRLNVRAFSAPLVFLLAAPYALVSPLTTIVIWWFSPAVVVLVMRLLARK